MSIRLRLTLWYTGILSLTLLVFGVGLYGLLHFYYYDSVETDLKDRADTAYTRIQPRITPTLGGDISFDFVLQGRDLLNNTGTYYQLTSFDNGNQNRSNNLKDLNLYLPQITESQKQRLSNSDYFIERSTIDTFEILIYNRPIYLSQNGQTRLAGVFQAAVIIESYEKVFALLRLILTVTSLLLVVLAASFGWFLARKALRPIDKVIDAANLIEKGADLGNRINYDGPHDEIGRLTSTINGMLGRLQNAYTDLEESYRRQRRFVSDASHELRTPLTTIRGNVDLLEKMWRRTVSQSSDQDRDQLEMSLEAMQDIAGEAERMTRLVNDLLALARADAGFQMEKIVLPLKPLVEQVVRKAQLLPRTVEWIAGDLSALDDVQVTANKDYLQQLIFIFIENAFKYTETGYVKLDAARTSEQVGLRIQDTGIGMDKEEVPHIFDRFYRADVSRGKTSGTGLGLSIAKWIIDEHHGSIEVTTRKGEGTTFIIWLPLNMLPTTFESGHSLQPGNQV